MIPITRQSRAPAALAQTQIPKKIKKGKRKREKMIMESDEVKAFSKNNFYKNKLIETSKPSKSIDRNGSSGFQRFWAQEANRLIVFTLAGVVLGVSLGILLISVADLSEDVIGYIEYPGEIMMRNGALEFLRKICFFL